MDKFTLIKDQAFDEGQLLATARDKSQEVIKARRREIQDAKEAYRAKERAWKAEQTANRLAAKKFRYEALMEKQAGTFARRNGLLARGAIHEPRRPLARGEEYRLMVDVIKTAAVCTDCGKDWEPVALGFDHLPERGEKSFNLSKGASKPMNVIMAEMAKCEIVCHACHAIRTNNRIKAKKQAA